MALSKYTKNHIISGLSDKKAADELIKAIDSATVNTVVKNTNYSANTNDLIFADSSSGSLTITLPPKPAMGDWVEIADFAETWATNNVIVARNGKKIQGVENDFTLNVNGSKIKFVFVGKNRGWNVLV